MNVFILTDIEGISGICRREQVHPGDTRYEEGRRMLTEEINVCAEALKEAGVEKVFVRDGHAQGTNILWEKLSDAVDYCSVGDTGESRFPGIEECEYMVLLGRHAMAGVLNATLEHSLSSATIQNFWINGQKGGEIAINAAIAGDKGVKVILVTGDDKACEEARALMPWVTTAEVKKGLTWNGAMLLPRGKAHALIRQKTIEAVRNAQKAQLFQFEKPVRFRVELTERQRLPNRIGRPSVNIIDGRTFEVYGNSMEEALHLGAF